MGNKSGLLVIAFVLALMLWLNNSKSVMGKGSRLRDLWSLLFAPVGSTTTTPATSSGQKTFIPRTDQNGVYVPPGGVAPSAAGHVFIDPAGIAALKKFRVTPQGVVVPGR